MTDYLIKTWEAPIRADLYCAFKDAFKGKVRVLDYEFNHLAVEYPTGLKRKADLVIMANYLKGPPSPFLVIEVKRRVKHPGRSLANATKQARLYAEELKCRFFAVYDGWLMLVFENIPEFLITACKVEVNGTFARNLLVGLVEYAQKGVRIDTTLQKLPKPPDSYFLIETILPPIAKIFVSKESISKELKKIRTHQLRVSWLQILRDLDIAD